MEKKNTVVILQDCKQTLDECASALKKNFDVVACSLDGEEGIRETLLKNPDFLITSLVLQSLDGFGVIEEVNKKLPDVKIIVLTNFTRGELVKRAIELGAVYYMVKPVNYELLIKRMENLVMPEEKVFSSLPIEVKRSGGVSLDEKISRIFINVGIPPHIKGYSYLREGIKMAVNNPDIINSITKKLYPAIGEKFNTSSSKVERAIRHAIEVAWNKGRVDTINALFGVRVYTANDHPTNSEFIALIADKMLLDGVS